MPGLRQGEANFRRDVERHALDVQRSINDCILRLDNQGYYNVLDYGATNTGTVDATAGIQAALDAAYAAGGGTVLLPIGTYLLDSLTGAYTTITPRSGVSVVGQGPLSILKVGDGLRTASHGTCVLYDHTTPLADIVYHNFTVDFNGANNLDTFGTTVSAVNRMGGAGGLSNVHFRNLELKNAAGSHFLWASADSAPAAPNGNVTIVGCTFTNCAGAITGNMVGDHSSIYINVPGAVIAGNTFIQPNTNDTVATAIEVHGVGVVVSGNVVTGYDKAANIAADDGDTTDISVTGNVCKDIVQGVVLWNAGTYLIQRINITGNTFLHRQNAVSVFSSLYTDTGTMAGSVNGSTLRFADNTCVGPSSGVTLGWQSKGVLLYRWDDIEISGNHFANFPCEGIQCIVDPGVRSLARIQIHGNQFTACGIGTVSSNKRAIGIASGGNAGVDEIEDLIIADNHIICSDGQGTAASWGIRVSGTIPTAYLANNFIVGATTVAVSKDSNVTDFGQPEFVGTTDASLTVPLRSGATAGQLVQFDFRDYTNISQWLVGKTGGNNFQIVHNPTAITRLLFNATNTFLESEGAGAILLGVNSGGSFGGTKFYDGSAGQVASISASGAATFTQLDLTVPGDYADDTAAASGGVAVGQVYRNGSVLMIRVA